MPETVGVHGQPVEDGAHVHVGAQFGAGIVGITGLVGEDHRIINALLPAQQVVIDGHVHGAGRGLKPHFRLVAAVVGGVDGQCINRIRQGGPTGVIEVKTSAAATPGQEVRAVVSEVRDGPAGLNNRKGDDAVRQDHGPAVVGHGYVGSGACAAAGDIGMGPRGSQEKEGQRKYRDQADAKNVIGSAQNLFLRTSPRKYPYKRRLQPPLYLV